MQLIKSTSTKCPNPPRTIKKGTVIITTGSLEKSIRLFLNKAKPALKADTAVNKLMNNPCPIPNLGINDRLKQNAPINSVIKL